MITWILFNHVVSKYFIFDMLKSFVNHFGDFTMTSFKMALTGIYESEVSFFSVETEK